MMMTSAKMTRRALHRLHCAAYYLARLACHHDSYFPIIFVTKSLSAIGGCALKRQQSVLVIVHNCHLHRRLRHDGRRRHIRIRHAAIRQPLVVFGAVPVGRIVGYACAILGADDGVGAVN